MAYLISSLRARFFTFNVSELSDLLLYFSSIMNSLLLLSLKSRMKLKPKLLFNSKPLLSLPLPALALLRSPRLNLQIVRLLPRVHVQLLLRFLLKKVMTVDPRLSCVDPSSELLHVGLGTGEQFLV